MKKTFLLILVIVFIGIGIFYLYRQTKFSSNSPPTNNQANKINVYEVINIDKPIKPIPYTVGNSTTALELLQKTTTITVQSEGVNAYVTVINGRRADVSKKEYWAFYINGKLSSVGAGSYQLRPNDKIEWKIKTY